MRSKAVYSSCERYRYALSRDWAAGRRLLYVMLNPSRATERDNDPTIERCQRRAAALGYGGFGVVNLFGWRETSPARLRRVQAPVGADNDACIRTEVASADDILAAWGVHGDYRDQGAAMARLLWSLAKPVYTLGLTKAGHPRHPLYVAYAEALRPWEAP